MRAKECDNTPNPSPSCTREKGRTYKCNDGTYGIEGGKIE